MGYRLERKAGCFLETLILGSFLLVLKQIPVSF